MSHKNYRSDKNCLNCGHAVDLKFCPACGQENLELRENFFHIAGHVIADFFHYDSKFFRSIIPLVVKPGFLTKEYWHGKRVNYIHPLRLFFFITVIFMISTTYFYHHFDKEIKGTIIHTTYGSANLDVPGADRIITPDSNEAKVRDSLYYGMDNFFKNLKYISFFLLPFYAWIFKLLFRKQRSFYVDHLVFTFHLQSFAYLLISVTILLPFVFPESLTIIRRVTILVIMVYMAFALRRLYHKSWLQTILKSILATFIMIFSMSLILGLFMGLNLLMDLRH
jgi:hypothetical protein